MNFERKGQGGAKAPDTETSVRTNKTREETVFGAEPEIEKLPSNER